VAAIVAFADLFFGAKIQETLTAAGHDVALAAGAAEGGAPPAADVLIVDLDAPGDPMAIGAGGDAKRIGFYSHVDVGTRRRAERAGFDLVVPRSRMAREMPALVERVIASCH
jgi:hypothetical protein